MAFGVVLSLPFGVSEVSLVSDKCNEVARPPSKRLGPQPRKTQKQIQTFKFKLLIFTLYNLNSMSSVRSA